MVIIFCKLAAYKNKYYSKKLLVLKLLTFFVGIKMQGYLSKKSEKNKKWKSMYFVLIVDGTDTHLCFYDNPKVCIHVAVKSL